LPPRPKVDFCILDKQPIQEAIKIFAAAQTPEEKLHAFMALQTAPLCRCSDGDKKNYDLDLERCDKFVALDRLGAQKLVTYVVELEKTLLQNQKSK
jgi:hypothetical protein